MRRPLKLRRTFGKGFALCTRSHAIVLFPLLSLLILASGCSSDNGKPVRSENTTITTTVPTSNPAVPTTATAAVANPASVYCETQGGTVEIVTDASGGQAGICNLPDGSKIDEWELFRRDQSSSISSVSPSDTKTGESPVAYNVFQLAPGNECDVVVATPRTSTVEGPLGDAISQLLAGPTVEEKAKGLQSWFSSDTSAMLRSVIVEDGVARISFAKELATTIPNASSSCGSAGLLAQLDATAMQFDSVKKVEYSFDGDVASFYEWLQRVPPTS